MEDDAARRNHTRDVAYVRWQLASEKYEAMTRALADQAVGAEEVRRAAAEVGRRHAEWMQFAGRDTTGGRGPSQCGDSAVMARRD
jgi:hypothetical protein